MLKLDFEQARIKEQERLERKIAKNKNRMVTISFAIVVLVLILIAVIATMVRINKPEVIIDNANSNLRYVNGKLANYIKGLGNSYYIRYLGAFGEDNWNKEVKETTVEYTREGSNYVLYSKDLERHVVTKGEDVYSVIHSFRVIVQSKLPVDFGSSVYNLVSDFGQRYVADVKVRESGVEYIYQEYEYENAKIRYYFVDEELRYIKVITDGVERKINVIVDRHVKKELFEMPGDYSKAIA